MGSTASARGSRQTRAMARGDVQSSIRVAKESWGLLSIDCRANRPHVGLCPEANVPLQGRPGSRGCIPDAPGETGMFQLIRILYVHYALMKEKESQRE